MITVENLTQVYKSGKGIFDLSFTVKEGEVFGYLGPNGAGKTTTIRNLIGFANATRGRAASRGIDCRKEASKLQSDIGYLPGEIAFFEEMTGFQFLKFIGEMRRTAGTSLRDNLIDQLELETGIKIRRMSKGMKQKPAVGGICFFFSCIFDTGSRALAFTGGTPAAFLLIKMLAGSDERLRSLRYLTLYSFIDVPKILGGGHYALTATLILLAVSVCFYMAGIVVFNKRSLATL